MQGAEESSGSRDGERNKAKLSEDAPPRLEADAAKALEGGEDVVKLLLAMSGKFQGLASSVDDPSQDELSCVPTTVAFQQFLQGHGFVPLVVRHGLGQHLVDAVK